MAAVDYFLKIDGVDGESEDSKHGKEIQLESWSFGATQSGTAGAGGGGGAGKASFQDFHFVMQVNKASPVLFEKCFTGKHIKQAILTCRKAGGKQEEYLIFKFFDLLISSYQVGGSGGGPLPMDQISFNYSKIQMHYAPQKRDGSLEPFVKTGYDLKAQKVDAG